MQQAYVLYLATRFPAADTVGTVFLLPSRSVRPRGDGVVVLDDSASRLVA